MRKSFAVAVTSMFIAAGWTASARGAGDDTLRINGDDAKLLLGDGTGVVVGIIDSGIDINHPYLTGTVTGGLLRLRAQANFVTTEPSNTGDDVFGHGTAVAGQILSRDSTRFGIATDARYVNARVLDSTNSFSTESWVVNGAGFALSNGANLLNLSLGYFNSDTSGNTKLALMTDYITFGRRIPVTVSAGNAGNTANPKPQGPGDAYNGFSTASTSRASGFSRIVSSSSYGPSTDGRNQPSISAPGDQVTTAAQHTSGFNTWSGTSFAAPNVAGMLAAQMEYGTAHGMSIDPLVLKATILNSAEKISDRNGAAWAPTSASTSGGVLTATSPLNSSAGAGQVDGLKLFSQYSPGQMSPGPVSAIGWDRNTVSGVNFTSYDLGQLAGSSTLTATLNWFRHVAWSDANADSVINSADSFFLSETFDNLDLSIFRDGALYAQSVSTVDSLEHLALTNIPVGDYVLRVSRLSGGGAGEEYGLAWAGTPLPEPASATVLAVALLIARRRR